MKINAFFLRGAIMLANDLTLDKADGTDVVFKLVSQDANGTRRIDVASTLALPTVLNIKHSSTGKAPGQVIDRHLVQVNKTVATSTGVATANANFTLTIPRDVAITSTIIHDLVTHIVDFLTDAAATGLATSANIDALLRGES
jgi:hypothetical protein